MSDVPRGPWAWAALMKWEDLVVGTAVLLGHTFDEETWPYNLRMGPFRIYYKLLVPKTEYARLWLAQHGVEVTQTLWVRPLNP